MEPSAVLGFWFEPRIDEPLYVREEWFRKSDSFDGEIRARFAPEIELALSGRLDDWSATREGTLALILLLDQFTRNVFRETPPAFSGDIAALSHARALVYSGRDREFAPIERWFVYMPFEHAENLVDQYESVRLFQSLADAGLADPLTWAVKHFEVIRRFGRFPHRNAVLGRASTLEEAEFVAQPGSRF